VPAFLVRDALRTAEMLRKEVQLVGSGLVRQLVQALLGGRRRLERRTDMGGSGDAAVLPGSGAETRKPMRKIFLGAS